MTVIDSIKQSIEGLMLSVSPLQICIIHILNRGHDQKSGLQTEHIKYHVLLPTKSSIILSSQEKNTISSTFSDPTDNLASVPNLG